VDSTNAAFVVHAFKRYATGLVSLTGLADELYSMGLRSKGGRKVYRSNIDKILKNPVYCGHIRWKGAQYAGAHEPLVSQALFDTVQEAFAPNRAKNNAQKRSYVLRDFLSCAEYGPADLVAQATAAEAAGFDALWISDHFHPWNDEQGNSPDVWGMNGEISQGFGMAGPTGGARARFYGYGGGVSEIINFTHRAEDAVDGWMATLYHRLPMIYPGNTEMGYGVAGTGPSLVSRWFS